MRQSAFKKLITSCLVTVILFISNNAAATTAGSEDFNFDSSSFDARVQLFEIEDFFACTSGDFLTSGTSKIEKAEIINRVDFVLNQVGVDFDLDENKFLNLALAVVAFENDSNVPPIDDVIARSIYFAKKMLNAVDISTSELDEGDVLYFANNMASLDDTNIVERLKDEPWLNNFLTRARSDSKLVGVQQQVRNLEDSLNDVREAKVQQLNSSTGRQSDNFYDSEVFNEVKRSSTNIELIKAKIAEYELVSGFENTTELANILQKALNDEKLRKRFLISPEVTANIDQLTAVQSSDSPISDSILTTSISTGQLVDQRLNDIVLSAGDWFNNYGAWIKGDIGRGRQKTKRNIAGYKFNNMGLTVGFDAGDDMLFGVAYSYYHNNVKNSFNASNKENIDSHIGTLYSKVNFGDELYFYAKGQIGGGNIDIRRNSGDLNSNIARAKTNSNIYALNIQAAYNFDIIDDIALTPILGLGYNQVRIAGYSETGSGLNRKVGSREVARSSLLGAVNAAMSYRISDTLVLRPVLRASADFALSLKADDVKITLLDGLSPIITPVDSKKRPYYKLGGGLILLSQDDYEADLSYDFGLSDGLTTHNASLKFRVNL